MHIGGLGLGAGYRALILDRTHAEVSEAAAAAAEAAPGVEIVDEVVDGFPIPVLTAGSQNAALVVVGDGTAAASIRPEVS